MDLINWLLDSDPSIRWQVMRNLLNKTPAIYEAERARVAVEGWGAALLARQDRRDHLIAADLFRPAKEPVRKLWVGRIP